MADQQKNISLTTVQEEGIQNVRTTMNELFDIWNRLGVTKEQQIVRSKNAWIHVVSTIKDILSEENGIYENVVERIQNYSTKIAELCRVLALEPKVIGGSLIERGILMRHELVALMQLKRNRMRSYQDLANTMLNHCKVLKLPNNELKNIDGVPTEKDINELKERVSHLEMEIKKRLAKLSAAKKQLSTILEATELPPETVLEQEILSGKDNFSLSEEILAEVEEVVVNASKRKSYLESQKKDLIEKLSCLWKHLNTDEKEKVEFLSTHLDCRVSTIDSIKREIEKCEQQRKENLQNIVLNLRSNLEDLWMKCYASENQKDLFPPPTEFTEEIFQEHENQINKWECYYQEVQHILQKIVKRQELFDLMKVFEKKQSDPNRFKNRKGNLLQEEKDRKKMLKDLPALELTIMKWIQEYETNTGQLFLYYGGDYKTFLENQWTMWHNEKEKLKLKKEKHDLLQLKNEITPALKRRSPSVARSAPGKLFKSSHRNAFLQTPVTIKGSSPNTNTKRRKFCSLKKHTLKDHNRALPEQPENQLIDDTTYELFVGKLNFAGENQLESTAILGKKGKSQKLKTVKVVRRSPRNKLSSFKSSPSRGKFGLPFIM